MLITYIRSSSYSKWDMCPFSYYMEYVLGWRPPSGKAADIGTISHKVMEFYAKKKLCFQNGTNHFIDEESKREFTVEDDFQIFVDAAWDYYTKGPAKHHQWSNGDKKKVMANVYDYLNYKDGQYNPLKLDIIKCEDYFDIEIKEPWAKYDYKDDKGNVIQGNLAIKGTMDLVTKYSLDCLNYIDYKTGKRFDWAKDKEKSIEDIYNDFQVRLYHYALSLKYPEYKVFLMTFFYNNDGGPYHVAFERDDHEKIMKMLKSRFETIKSSKMPKQYKSWKCTRLCKFGSTLNKDSPFYKGEDNGKTICESVYQELQTIGLERLTNKHSGLQKVSNYNSGGGRSNRESE